jgi:hypothetical protein
LKLDNNKLRCLREYLRSSCVVVLQVAVSTGSAQNPALIGSWVCQKFLGGDFLACAELVDTPSYRISFC